MKAYATAMTDTGTLSTFANYRNNLSFRNHNMKE